MVGSAAGVVPHVVVVVVPDATVVVVQQGLVGKVVVRSIPKMVGWLLLHSRQVKLVEEHTWSKQC